MISALAIDPFNPSVLYALAGSLCKSTDRGQHWTSLISPALSTLRFSAQQLIAFDPGHANTLYFGANNAVLKSVDGGANWTSLAAGLPGSANIQALAVDPVAPSTIYAGTYSSGVYKSVDAGTNWTAVNAGLTSLGVTALLVDPSNPSTVYAGIYSLGNIWLFKSANGGDQLERGSRSAGF